MNLIVFISLVAYYPWKLYYKYEALLLILEKWIEQGQRYCHNMASIARNVILIKCIFWYCSPWSSGSSYTELIILLYRIDYVCMCVCAESKIPTLANLCDIRNEKSLHLSVLVLITPFTEGTTGLEYVFFHAQLVWSFFKAAFPRLVQELLYWC